MGKLKRYSLKTWRGAQFIAWAAGFCYLLDDRFEPITRVAGGLVWIGIGLSYRLRLVHEALTKAKEP